MKNDNDKRYEFFHKEPGLAPAHDLGDGTVEVLHGTPSVVRLPADLGGEVRRVLHAYDCPCPCRAPHTVPAFALEGGIHVAECTRRGFLWFQP